MKPMLLILGWCLCVVVTLGTKFPRLLVGEHYPITLGDSNIVDSLVMWGVVAFLWWVWFRGCVLCREGLENLTAEQAEYREPIRVWEKCVVMAMLLFWAAGPFICVGMITFWPAWKVNAWEVKQNQKHRLMPPERYWGAAAYTNWHK